MALKPPENDYFSINALLEHWNIDKETFWRYVKHEKLLRVALPATDNLCCIKAEDIGDPTHQWLIEQARNFPEPCEDLWLEDMIREAGTIFNTGSIYDAKLRELPAFLYPTNSSKPHATSAFFTDYAGDLYLFADEIVDSGGFRNTIVHLNFGEYAFVVERQERDRFEALSNDESGELAANPPASPAKFPQAVQRFPAQDAAIDAALRALGYDPLNIPPHKPGVAGVKSKVHEHLNTDPLFTIESFNHAWKRAKAREREAKQQPVK
jgi:hypothetical protein